MKAEYKFGHVMISAGGSRHLLEIHEATLLLDELYKAIKAAMLDDNARKLDQLEKFQAPAPGVE